MCQKNKKKKNIKFKLRMGEISNITTKTTTIKSFFVIFNIWIILINGNGNRMRRSMSGGSMSFSFCFFTLRESL